MKKSLKLWVAVFSCCVALATVIMGTYATFTSSDIVENKMRIALCNSKIIEKFDGNEKSVFITNVGETPLLVRANAEMVCKNGNLALDAEKIADAEYTNLLDGEDFPADKWVYGNDGWYYYSRLLHPGETTAELVHIMISSDVDLSDEEQVLYNNAELDVPVQLEYHYPHKIEGEYPHEENWNLEDGFVKDMLRSLADLI